MVSSLTSSLESWESKARVAEGEVDTCSRGPGLMTECLGQQEQQEQKPLEDLVSRVLVLTSPKEEMLACKRRLDDKEAVSEESEALHEETRQEKNHLSNQLTSVSLARDALEDEARHLREEVGKLKGQHEVAQIHVANITQGIDQLVFRLAIREREVADLMLRTESLEREVKRLEGVAEDWKRKAEGEEGRARKLQEELLLGQDKLEGLHGQVFSLRSRLEEETRKMSQHQEQTEGLIASKERRIQELSPLAGELRMELVVEKGKAGERLEVSTSSELLAEEEGGNLETARDSLTLELDVLKNQLQVSHSTTRDSQDSAVQPPPASSNDSLKRPADIEGDFDHQKKARTNINTEVLSSMTGPGGGSSEIESDMSMQEEGGEERGQVVEVEALDSEQEENSSEAGRTRTEEATDAGSSPLLTVEHVCDGCQSVFTRAATLRHHQAVAGRCKRVKEMEPEEFACHRCFKHFNSKGHWSKHVSFVLDCSDKKQRRNDKMMEVVGLLEVQGLGEELCQEVHALEVLPAGSPVSLPGPEVTESPEGGPEGDHCYARSSTQAPEHRQSSHNPGQPVQVKQLLVASPGFSDCQRIRPLRLVFCPELGTFVARTSVVV